MEKYNEKINRYTDWGGDASTGGLKVSGRRVQEFIKEELNSKVGAIHKDEGGTVVYCFANEEDKQKYLTEGDTSVILTSFETFSKYKVLINQETLVRSHSVIYGTKGNTVEFQFKIVDESEMITDSKASVEYSFLANGIVTGYTTETQMSADGWTTVKSENIDRFLKKGENTITITVTGLSTRASSQFIITYNLFDLDFVTLFNFNEVQKNRVISIPYIIECSETKYLEFYIDGTPAYSNESMVINDVRKDGTANINIENLEPGLHTLQVGAYVKANDGTEFHTPYHFYTFSKIGSANPNFLMSLELDKRQNLILEGQSLELNIDQFELLTFNWSLYLPATYAYSVIAEYDGDVVAKSVFDTNGKINTLTFRPMNYGEGKLLKIYAYEEDDETKAFEYVITLNVSEVTNGIKETTDGLLLKMEANGRRNSDTARDEWTCIGSDGVEYFATFNDFAWNSQQGWNEEDEALVISNGAIVEFNLKPMVRAWNTYGGTFEIDLETFDIDDDDAVICECKDNIEGMNSSYFRITATNAEFSTTNGVKINTRYKDNERLKIAFIGNKIGNHEDGNLIYIVVNGVLERAALYEDFDSLVSNAILKIGNPEGKCKVKLRSIRAYNRAISVDEEFNNFVVDSNNVQEIYEKNNVLKEGSTEIGFDEVANKLPVMIFTGDMNELARNGQDKKWRYFDVEFINRQHPEFNFVSFNCQIKLQGTSSLGYPRKNFKLKTKDNNFTPEKYATSTYIIDESSVVGNKMLRNKITGELIDFGVLKESCYTFGVNSGNTNEYIPLKKGKYRFKKDSHKADKWTLKADFMESSCSHNVAAGRSWNAIFENTKFELTLDSTYTNNTYNDEALVYKTPYRIYERDGITYKINNNTEDIKNQKAYVCRTDAQKICKAEGADDIRTAVDGFPMVCFYRTSHQSNDLVFMGQYNFINDKSSYEVFGFEDIEDPTDPTEKTMIYDASQVECWEGLKNANPISLFQTIKDWTDKDTGWASTYESRYPDPDDYGVPDKKWYDASVGSPLYELSKWLVSTRHSGETIYDLEGNQKQTGGTITIDASFARRINNYQYGYTEESKDEFEYADGEVPDTAENRQKKFETEKWEHFDVWKLAGYYIYLMRYGAVDQFVKNTMLFTDGNGKYDPRTDKKYRKWFFINYDNDCLFGLRNNGELAFHWDLDRQTLDGASDIIHDEGDDYAEEDVNTYAMMGHDSTLWNNLEADAEFMRMVMDLDNAMSSYGLNYDNMVTEFDTNQTEQWCERIYNANEKYKYIQAAKGIGDMAGNPVNNLWMLQGTRRSHRHWWIANRFNLLNAKWLSGDYKNTYVEIKTDSPAGDRITAKAGTDYYFAWGQQKKIYESNIVKKENDPIEFIFSTNQVQGDPVYIYAVNKMSEIDFSEIADKIATGSFEFHMPNTNVSNLLKKLVIGNPLVRNTATGITTSSWECLTNLEYLDITNYEGIKIIPLTSFPNLHVLKAKGSGISSFAPADGSRYSLAELPTNISTLTLNNVKFDNLRDDLVYTPNINLQSLTLSNNGDIGIAYFEKIVKPWINQIENSNQAIELYRRASIDISNIKWGFTNLNDVRLFKNFSRYGANFTLKGVINLTGCGSLSQDNINEIKSIFGENCFNEKMSSLYVKTPDSIFIVPESDNLSIVAGQTYNFGYELYPDAKAIFDVLQDITYGLVRRLSDEESKEDALYDPTTGLYYKDITDLDSVRRGLRIQNNPDYTCTLITEERVEGSDTDIIVIAKLSTLTSSEKFSCIDFKIKDPTYATRGTLVGNRNIYKGEELVYSIEGKTANDEIPLGTHVVTWELEGEGLDYVASTGVVDNNLVITMKSGVEPERFKQISVTATYTNNDATHTSFVVNQTILVLNSEVVITNETNPVVMDICYNNGLCSSSIVMLRNEAAAVTNISNYFSGVSSQFGFPEFAYFTSVTSLSDGAFAGSNITEICLPSSLRTLGKYCFKDCNNLQSVTTKIADTVVEALPEGITEVSESCFEGCTSLSKLRLPNTITKICNYSFGGTNIKHMLLHTEALNDNTLILPDTSDNTDFVLEGLAFDYNNGAWTANSEAESPNKLETISIPENIRATSNHYLWSGSLSRIIVHPDCTKMVAIDNVLYTYDMNTLLRYAPLKERVILFNVPVDTTSVSERAFYKVKNLDEIVFENSISEAGIARAAFEKSEIKVIDLSNCLNLTKINDNTFNGCTELESVLLPDMRLDTIESNAFKNCSSLSTITLPDTIATMKTSAIYRCSSLTYLKFPKYCSTEYSHVVDECRNLTGVTLPIFSYERNGEYIVKDFEGNVIGNTETMNEAKKLKPQNGSIEVIQEGESVNVNNFAVLFVSPLTLLKYYYLNDEDDRKKYDEIDGIIYNADDTVVVKVPFYYENYIMPNKVTEIDINAFNNCHTKSLILSEGLTRLNNVNGLDIETITIPKNIITIEDGALSRCEMLRTVYIMGDLERIGSQAFYLCPNIEEVYIYGSLGSIGTFAFVSNNSMLHKLVLLSPDAPVLDVSVQGTKTEIGGIYEVYNSDNILYDRYTSYKVALEKAIKTNFKLEKVFDEDAGVYMYEVSGPNFVTTRYATLAEAEAVALKTDWRIVVIRQAVEVYMYHPFGYSEYNLVGKGYEGDKTLYLPYGYMNYDNEKWQNPLLNSILCNFNIEYYSITNDSIVAKIYKNGVEYTTGTVYAVSESGDYSYGNSNSIASATYNASKGGFEFIVSHNLYDNETLTFYSDIDCQDENKLGEITIRESVIEYQSGEPTFGATRSKGVVLGAGKDEMANITQREYEMLVSKVNNLLEIINKIK